jgi:ferredoxin-type protein NapF
MRDRVNNARRNLLRGIPLDTPVFRPPWAIAEAEFLDLCTSCGDCVRACPEDLVHVGAGNYPEVRFGDAECTFCRRCVDSCNEGALSQAVVPPWRLKPAIDESCLAKRGVVCESCRDVCDERAIRFDLRAGRVANPSIRLDDCTGCGACVSACPAEAIALAAPKNEEEVAYGQR